MKLTVLILAEFFLLLASCWGTLNIVGKLNVLLCEKKFQWKRVKIPRYLYVPLKGTDSEDRLYPFRGLTRQDDGKVYVLTVLLTIFTYLVALILLAIVIILYIVTEIRTLWLLLLVNLSYLIYACIIMGIYEIVKYKTHER